MTHRGNGPARPETGATSTTSFETSTPLSLLVEQESTLLELEAFLQVYGICHGRPPEVKAGIFEAIVEILGDLRAQNTCLLKFFNRKGGGE